jgi:hypothetical protein
MIITTINLFTKKNGGTERVKNIVNHFNIKEVTIITFFQYKSFYKDGIRYDFKGIKIVDIFNIINLLLFSNLPFSVCLFQRNDIKYSNNLTIFHLTRSFQFNHEKLIFSKKNNFILDYCESHSHNLTKRLTNISKLFSYILKFEIHKLNLFEDYLLDNFQKIYFITNNDIKFIANKHNVLPNKVKKILYFEPYSKRKLNKLVFIGDMTYLPNILALQWLDSFLNNTDYEVHVIGRFNNKPRISNINKIIFYGYIENIENIIKDSIGAVFFSKESTGLQNKILDYLNYGIPVFTNAEVVDSFIPNHPFIIINNYYDLELNLNIIKNSKIKFEQIINNGFNYLKTHYSL